jgi:hypothetical protein
MKHFSWTQEADERIVALTAEGKSAREIASLFPGMTRNAVLGRLMRLRDRGVIEGPRAFQKSPDYKPAARGRSIPGLAHVPAIRTMLDGGRTDREIADEIGIKPDDVRYVRRIKGWGANAHVRQALAVADQLAELVKAGRCDREVADTLGISLYQARWERRRQGVKPANGVRQPSWRLTTIVKGDSAEKVTAVFCEGFMEQRSRLSLAELPRWGACRFPIDQLDGSLRYCGAAAGDGQSYCADHHARCYVTVRPVRPQKPLHITGARR